MTAPTFRDAHPLSWAFHANTARFAHNAEPPSEDVWPDPAREAPELPLTPLPPGPALTMTLDEVLRSRCSCRQFTADALPLATLSSLLRAAYGVVRQEAYGPLDFATRTVPSGGALFPLELSLICRHVEGLASGIYHYLPSLHALECVKAVEVPPPFLTYLFMGQAQLTAAPLLVVLSAAFGRTMKKYGDRGYRYILLEAGHAMQNLNLASTVLGLGSCNIGGFFDDELAGLLGLPAAHEGVLYATAIGMPAAAGRQQQRDL